MNGRNELCAYFINCIELGRKKTPKTATKIELKQTKILAKIHLQMHSYLICRLHEFLIICWELKLIRISCAYSIHCKIIRNIPGQQFAKKKINSNSNRNVCSFFSCIDKQNKTIQTDSNVLSSIGEQKKCALVFVYLFTFCARQFTKTLGAISI